MMHALETLLAFKLKEQQLDLKVASGELLKNAISDKLSPIPTLTCCAYRVSACGASKNLTVGLVSCLGDSSCNR